VPYDITVIRLRSLEWLALVAALAFSTANWFDAIPASSPIRIVWVPAGLTLIVLALVGLGRAAAMWRRERWRSLLLPTLALSGLVLAYAAGTASLWYRDRAFLHALPTWQRVVDRFIAGRLPPGVLPLDSLPAELRSCCYRVEGMRDSTGGWRVEFWVGRRFPVHHEAWMYYGGASVRVATRDGAWYSWYRLAPHWYRVTD